MEYMEIPTIPKAMLDNLLATMANPASFKEPAPVRNNDGYKPLPVPLFHSAPLPSSPAAPVKGSGASLPPLPGDIHRRESSLPFLLFPSPPESLLKDHSSAGSLKSSGLGPIPIVKDKPKRVRKSRAGATARKMANSDPLTANADANLNGADMSQQPQDVPPPKRKRPSAKAAGNGENAEKPPPRKCNRNKGKAKEEHAMSSLTNEPAFSHSDSTSSKGIPSMYGIDAKTLDLTQYITNSSLEGLMLGDFNVSLFPNKRDLPPSCIIDRSFGMHVGSILQNLARPSNAEPPPQRRPSSLFAKPVERQPHKFMLDLESTPFDDNEESLCGALPDTKVEPSCYGSDSLCSQSRKPQEGSSLFPIETFPVIPPAEFWNMLQLHPNESLHSLLTQAAASSESRISPTQAGARPVTCNNKTTSFPPSLFSFDSGQALQENACDKITSSRINHWFRTALPKREFSETQPDHMVGVSEGSRFPFKLNFEESPMIKPADKLGQKEGLFDIDLNKQSPEAEAAESTAYSFSIFSSKHQLANEAPLVVQARIETEDDGGGGGGSQAECSKKEQEVDIATPLVQAEATCCDIDQVMVDGQVVNHALQKNTSSPQKHGTKGGQNQEFDSLSVYVNKEKQSTEPVKAAPTNASSSLPLLSVPASHEIQEIHSDVPYSPGVQATARILCKMASSSSPFYVENDDESGQVAALCNGTPIQLVKPTRIVGPIETDVKAHKYPAPHESWDEEQLCKIQARDGKERTFSNQMASSCTPVGEKANGPEPWASTPPRNAPKSVASPMSGSQSSESDRSPYRGVREHTSNEVYGKANRMETHQQSSAAALSKISNPFTQKEGKGSHTTESKTSFLYTTPTKSTTVFLQRKNPTICETKQSGHGEGLAKLCRPRSNSGKNCLPLHRSASSYPVKPRNANGCSVKSPRQVLPYVGEIRHGSK